ncbi:MAG: hypothetical protein DME23_13215 [Verrucomicrobia bacterium]|nr:MAG: hypothetical protein DME23_13215 [Verrucomicrobiota bacterium]
MNDWQKQTCSRIKKENATNRTDDNPTIRRIVKRVGRLESRRKANRPFKSLQLPVSQCQQPVRAREPGPAFAVFEHAEHGRIDRNQLGRLAPGLQ